MLARIYTVAEIAEILRVSPRSVYRLIEDGDLRAVPVGRLKRIPEGALEEFLAGDPSEAEVEPIKVRLTAIDER
jgi:excisionase family DNA binding protein